MARQFAAIMGLLAFSTMNLRGLCNGYGFAETVWLGCGAAAIFAGGGALVGAIAEGILGEDLRTELADRMAVAQQRNTTKRNPGRG
ncbi:MAG: hypothetical protein QM811_10285 [Pirellulales bacterium]